jgi:PAS domain S-box-containing protein
MADPAPLPFDDESSDELINGIIDYSIVRLDATGKVMSSNGATAAIYGLSVGELSGKHFATFFPEASRKNGDPQMVLNIASAEGRHEVEGWQVRKDDSVVWTNCITTALRDGKGNLTGFVTIARDFTRRKWTEERFRLAVESAPNAMVMINSRGRMVLVNTQTERLFGYARQELIDRTIEILVPERFRSAHPSHRGGFFAEPRSRSMGAGRDLYGLRKDGQEFPVEIGLNPIKTDEGAFVLAAIVDITERKRAEERFRLVVESAPSAIVMINDEGKIILVNAQTEALFGYERHELLDKSIEALVPSRFRRKHPTFRSNFFVEPKARSMGAGRDLFGLRKDGTEVPVEIGLNPIKTAEGTFVLAAIVDITERKRAEERFRLVVESAPSAMVMINDRGKIVLVNAQTEKLFGFNRKALIDQSIEMLVPERFRHSHPAFRGSFFADPQSRSMGAGRDLFGLRSDGTEVPVEIGLNPIKTAEGAFVLAAIVDITERKRAEERFRVAVESAPNPMVMVNADGKIVLVNAQTEKLFGYSRRDLIDQSIEMLVPSRFRGGHPGHRMGFFAHPQARSMGAGRELFGLRRDGTEMPLEIGLNPIKTDEGAFVLAAIVDITERRKAEERFRLVVESAPSAMVMINDQGKVVLVNAQAEKLFGYGRRELLGESIEMLVPAQFRAKHPAFRTDFFGDPKARSMGVGRDLFGLRKDGSEVPVEIGLNPIRTDDGNFVLAAIVDITERKKAELQVAELDRAKTAFFSNVSHEFRTPLTLLLGPLEDALRTVDGMSGGQRERLEVSHRNALRLLKLVNTLLDFSRIEAGRIQAAFEPVDLPAYTLELASVFRSAVERAGLTFEVDCGDLAEPIHIDREMWEKIVFNLIANALKFTFKGHISIMLCSVADHVELSVTDSGIGIPADELPHLFERFYRVKNARSRTQEGTGIGLALVQELVRLHGGTIAVSSVPDRGSTFTVALPKGTAHLPKERIGAIRPLVSTGLGAAPYVEEALQWVPTTLLDRVTPELPVKVTSESDRQRGYRILLVDDNQDMRVYLQRLLAEHWVVETVADGAEGLRVARERRPDLVLSDVIMPNLDGFGLLRAMRADPNLAGVPVILLSARAGEEARVEGLEAGADDYLIKPFSARELIARVKSNLELVTLRRKVEQEVRERNAILEERVKERTARLEESVTELQTFAYTVSHDLRAPIRGMYRYAEMLLSNYPGKVFDTQAEGFAGNIASSAERMDLLVQDLLQYSRLTQAEMKLQEIALAPFVTNVLGAMESEITERKGRVSVEPNLPRVVGDPLMLTQALTNLVSNAIKFIRAGVEPKANIRAEQKDGRVRLWVEDNGIGIAPDLHSKLFQVFERLVKSDEYQGTGIGLAIVRKAVERMGGEVGLESQLGQGSRFWIDLPGAAQS